jgi:hypothetical protein
MGRFLERYSTFRQYPAADSLQMQREEIAHSIFWFEEEAKIQTRFEGSLMLARGP